MRISFTLYIWILKFSQRCCCRFRRSGGCYAVSTGKYLCTLLMTMKMLGLKSFCASLTTGRLGVRTQKKSIKECFFFFFLPDISYLSLQRRFVVLQCLAETINENWFSATHARELDWMCMGSDDKLQGLMLLRNYDLAHRQGVDLFC